MTILPWNQAPIGKHYRLYRGTLAECVGSYRSRYHKEPPAAYTPEKDTEHATIWYLRVEGEG